MRKTISFTKKYKKEYEYLCIQDNPSLYVRELIRKDMCDSKNKQDEIISLLQELTNNNDLIKNKPNKSNFKKNALKNIMDM